MIRYMIAFSSVVLAGLVWASSHNAFAALGAFVTLPVLIGAGALVVVVARAKCEPR